MAAIHALAHLGLRERRPLSGSMVASRVTAPAEACDAGSNLLSGAWRAGDVSPFGVEIGVEGDAEVGEEGVVVRREEGRAGLKGVGGWVGGAVACVSHAAPMANRPRLATGARPALGRGRHPSAPPAAASVALASAASALAWRRLRHRRRWWRQQVCARNKPACVRCLRARIRIGRRIGGW